MEDVLIIILQFLLEFFFNVLIDLPFDWPRKNRQTPESDKLIGTCFVMFCVSCGLAWCTLLVFPRTLIRLPALRIANLFLAPPVAAFIAACIADRYAQTNPWILPRNHFWRAFWFTLGFVAVRFAYVIRH